MKFKLGDFVRFIDEKREGYVTRLIDAQTLGVTDSDGFEIPVAISNLTSVYGHSSGSKSAEPKADKVLERQVRQEEVEYAYKGLYLAVVPTAKNDFVVQIYILNFSEDTLLLSLQGRSAAGFQSLYSGLIAAQSKMQLHTAGLNELDRWPEFYFKYLQQPKYNEAEFNTIHKKFKAKDFSAAKMLLPMLNAEGWLLKLEDKAVFLNATQLKDSFFKIKTEQIDMPEAQEEVDLHIEKIRSDYHFLIPEEILKYQLQHFHSALDAAIVHGLQKVVFIHGTGNGTLRNHIHKEAGKSPFVQTFLDARKEKFGYGATELRLK